MVLERRTDTESKGSSLPGLLRFLPYTSTKQVKHYLYL